VRTVALLACSALASCSPARDSAPPSRELIPAEWTVANDTSASGDITTMSVQLPAARQISGLDADQQSRLILRCIDHRVQAFIDTEGTDSLVGAEASAEAGTGGLEVPIELDSAPACE
jgi:hypothetical protein